VSSISDADYDAKYAELVSLETRYPELVDADSPTQRVGAPLRNVPTVRHTQRMLSLKNTKTASEVIAMLGQTRVCLEPKVDGVSLKLIYKKGRFLQAITRGDGTDGEDATAAARTIKTIPLRLRTNIDLTVVGEVFMRCSVFDELNAALESEGREPMANPRNAAAGSLRLKNPSEVASRKLNFVAYGIHTEFPFITTQIEATGFLESLDFVSVYMLPTTKSCQTVADCLDIQDEADLKLRIEAADVCRQMLDLPTDGLVFKIDDLSRQRELGDGTTYPHHSCAFKYPPERKPTDLLDITIQVGRTGKITPVAELRPLVLSGSVVRRASLCNADEIARLGLNVGDEVGVEKSAEVIPKIMGVTKKKVKGVYAMPTLCPCCRSPLVKPSGFVDLYCYNRDCDEQVFNRLRHAVSKDALDIDGCGEALIRDLMKHGVRSLYDLLTTQDVSFIKLAAREKFVTNREKAKTAPYWRKLHALGIEGMGTSICQQVTRWATLDKALATLELKNGEVTIEKVLGKVVLQELLEYLSRNMDEISRLEDIGFVLKGNEGSGSLTGKVFCVTGALSCSRGEIHDRIIAAGGTIKNSVTKTVDYLVMGLNAGDGKQQAARRFKVKIITEEQLEVMVEENAAANTD
jgi:DNA ligase (NAD+)